MSNQSLSISILIPCYNQEKIIKQVVQAAINQTHKADEIIVVDDGSHDNSAKIVQKLPVKLICHAQNRGLSPTRNTALSAARGEIVLFIDGDARPESNLVEIIRNEYLREANPNLAGVGGKGIEININNVYDRWRSIHARQDFGHSTRDNVPYLFGLCMSFKREIILKIGGFDPFFVNNCAEDTDVGFRLRHQGYFLRYTPNAIVYHLHNDTRETLKRNQYNWYYWGYLAKKRTKNHPCTLFAGTIRRLFMDTFSDLVIRQDLQLSQLDLIMFATKMKSLFNASRSKLV